MTVNDPRTILRSLFDAAVMAADPAKAVAANLPERPSGRTVVIGAGKAAIAMATAVERNWRGPLEGFVVAPHGYPQDLQRIGVVYGGHPVPDSGSLAAANRALALAATLKSDDLLIALVSGGGSALLSKPAPGIALDDKLAVLKALLKCGASIGELNCVRKLMSAVKGGRLARAAGLARIHTLVISDVPGDDPSVVASGPTVADHTTGMEARAILDRYRLKIPASISAALEHAGAIAAPLNPANQTRVIVSPHESFMAAQARAKSLGLGVLYLGDRIEAESRDVAKVHAAIALEAQHYGSLVTIPGVILSGGETGVTVRGSGRGGRNVEFSLSLAIALAGQSNIHALAADTDGVDGMEEVAGAMIDPSTLDRARARGLDAIACLENNDAHSFFETLGDQVITGPTHTNVNDFRAILIT